MKNFIVILLCLNIILAPVYAFYIEDDFVNSTLDKNLKIKNHKQNLITDDFVLNSSSIKTFKKDVVFDEILPNMPEHKFSKKPVIFDENYKEVKVKIKEPYTTKGNLDEGDYLDFVTLNDIKIKDKTYPKNSTVKARIETISLNKSWGVPSDVVVGNFALGDINLSGDIRKQGANRSLWLYPTIYGASIFFGAGLLLIPIRGGHAKIKPSDIYTLYAIE